MWEHFSGKSIFLTGGTGSLGAAVLCRLTSKAAPKRIYVLCRSGPESAEAKWAALFSPSKAKGLVTHPSISLLTGDLREEKLGLSDAVWDELKDCVNIIIHAGSSINLRQSLQSHTISTIKPSVVLAEFAMEFINLETFVYVSTAYANTHLWQSTRESDLTIKECIYPLEPETKPISLESLDVWDRVGIQTEREWEDVQRTGSSREFTSNDFPWPYAYAKHLTERLLVNVFIRHKAIPKLIILRPSVFCPSLEHPYPSYGSPTSTPSIGFAAAMLLYPGRHIRLASRSQDPNTEVTIDEVPIDVVVDRLLLHIAYGTFGCVHAVAGSEFRSRFCDWWPGLMKERRIPWTVKPAWTALDWHSPTLHPVAKLYVIVGTSFNFSSEKTLALWSHLNEEKQYGLRLDAEGHKPYNFETRRYQIRQFVMDIARKKGWPTFFAKLLSRPGLAQTTLDQQ